MRHGRFIWLRSKFSPLSYYIVTAFSRSDRLLGIDRAVSAVRWKVRSYLPQIKSYHRIDDVRGVFANKNYAVFVVYSTSEKPCMWPQFSNQISSFYSVTPALIYFSSLLSPISTQGAEELDLAVLIRQEASVVLICSFCLTAEF